MKRYIIILFMLLQVPVFSFAQEDDSEYENYRKRFKEFSYGSPIPMTMGETWSYYYTGIVQRQTLFVKWYSSYPMINEKGDLRL